MQQFSTSVSTLKPQHPNRLLSHRRPKASSHPSAAETPCCVREPLQRGGRNLAPSLLSSFVWLSQLIDNHWRFSFFGLKMEEWASSGAPGTEELTPDTEAAVNQTEGPEPGEKCSYLQLTDLWGFFSAFLTSFRRKSPAPPLLHRLSFFPHLVSDSLYL